MTWHSTYELLRQLADSWGLLVIALLWLSLALWPFRPGAQRHNLRAANAIFEDETNGE